MHLVFFKQKLFSIIYLHKILPLIASPLSLVIILLLCGAISRRRSISLFAVGLLVLCSLPIVSDKLVSQLEKAYVLGSADSAQTADAVVVLSGMVRTIEGSEGLVYEWAEASDRIFAGIELMIEQKAPLIVLTGGKLPWSVGIPEGEYLKEIAIKYGIPAHSIQITENVHNTDEEAKAVASLLKQRDPKIILVTSAFHMPRAQKVFEASGLSVLPFPVDFLMGADQTTIIDFIPSAGAFRNTSFVIREMIGRLYYHLKY